jgi:hypothetical protein
MSKNSASGQTFWSHCLLYNNRARCKSIPLSHARKGRRQRQIKIPKLSLFSAWVRIVLGSQIRVRIRLKCRTRIKVKSRIRLRTASTTKFGSCGGSNWNQRGPWMPKKAVSRLKMKLWSICVKYIIELANLHHDTDQSDADLLHCITVYYLICLNIGQKSCFKR